MQQRVPNPLRFSLHEAHLRSPSLKIASLSPAVYYFWQEFILAPQRVLNANAIETFSFNLTKKDSECLAKPLPAPLGANEWQAIDKNHKTLRLRCIKWPNIETPKHHEWATAHNSWIPYSFFALNKTSLQLRKKLHNGKDLPVDLTRLVKEGHNQLELAITSTPGDTSHRDYLVAIERLGVMSFDSVKRRCHEQTISADQTINDIKRKLSEGGNSDDDVVMAESTLSINLRDPFIGSKMCDVPVRGTACLHHECFDLKTFLDTRPKEGEVTAADSWLCPICKADARPNVLAVDEFLIQVRKALDAKGLSDTRAITVDRDGHWTPKPEERDPNGVQDDDTPEPSPIARSARTSIVHEVIELDSD